jgi:hypothetical protein
MDAASEIREMLKLEYKQIWLVVSALGGTLCPGILTLFHFKPEIVEKDPWLAVVLLSLALTLPLLTVNSVAWALLYCNLPDESEKKNEDQNKAEDKKNVEITKGALQLNAFVLYLSLLTCYLFSWKFKSFLIVMAALELLIFITGFGQLAQRARR